MAPMGTGPGPIRTAKTPRRVRFAQDDREKIKLIRQQDAEKRDARSLPRVDVDVSTGYELPAVSAAAGALYNYAKSTLGSMMEFGKTALSSSFGKVIPQIAAQDQTTQNSQASMLEYPPFVAGATPNVVRRNRRDYYQSFGVMSSIQKAKSYAPDRTPEECQSEKEKDWYRFHETPYAGHKLDFGKKKLNLQPLAQPEFRFESPTKAVVARRKQPSSAKKHTRKPSLKKRTKSPLGVDISARRSNADEFHANFSKKERTELYTSYTRFLKSIRFDVRKFVHLLREFSLPTELILKVHDNKHKDWDLFMRIMADEEYWGQVKGVGSTSVPLVENYAKPKPASGFTNPCEYCRGYEWAGKKEVREVENDGDEVPRIGQTKFDVPYTAEEQSYIDAGQYHKVFHRFCHESRYDWKFPDPGRPCTWEGPNSGSSDGKWVISKYDPRLRHFPLYMQKMPKRMRQIQQDLNDTIMSLTLQDTAAWYYIQGIRRYNTRMATLLEKMDLERKRQQVVWPCQLQVEVRVKNKPKKPTVSRQIEMGVKRSMVDISMRDADVVDTDEPNVKKTKFQIEKSEAAATNQVSPSDPSRKRTRTDKAPTKDTHTHKRPQKSGSFGLYSDEDTEDDEVTAQSKSASQEKTEDSTKATEKAKEKYEDSPRLSFFEKLDAAMKAREAELAALEAEQAKAKANRPPSPKIPSPKLPSPKPVEAAPVAPSVDSFASKPATQPTTAKPFVFEDPKTTQEPATAVDDGKNPLKEHTNGVKPAAPATSVPNLFGSAVPNLAPSTGFSFGNNQAGETTGIKPANAATTASGSGKTGTTGLFGNEENIPANTFVPPPASAPALFQPPAAAPSFPSFAPAPAPASAAAPAASASPQPASTAPPASIFSTAAPSAPAAAQKPLFSFGASAAAPPAAPAAPAPAPAQPAAAAPSIFSAAPAATESKTPFLFGTKPAEVKPAAPVAPPAAAAPPVFSFNTGASAAAPKPAAAPPVFSFGAAAKPAAAPAAAPSLFAAKPAGGMFGAAPTPPAPAPIATPSLFGAAPATTAAPAASNMFGGMPTASSASNTPSIFGTAPATSFEAPKPPSAPTFSFGAGPIAPAPSQNKPAAPAAGNLFGAKPVAAPTTFNFGAIASKPAEPASNMFSKPPAAPAAIGSTFTFGAQPAAPASAPTFTAGGNTQFQFGGSSNAPQMPTPFAPGTPQVQPPSFLFGGMKPNGTTPTKLNHQSPKFQEDISMASPEQSPQKSDAPRFSGMFGQMSAPTSAPAGGNSGFNTNKTFNFGPTAPVPSPLKMNFGAAPQENGGLKFGGPIAKAPTPAMPSAPAPATPAKFDFSGGFGSPAVATPPPAPPGSTFQFDAGGLDFSLGPTGGSRRIATPKRRLPGGPARR